MATPELIRERPENLKGDDVEWTGFSRKPQGSERFRGLAWAVRNDEGDLTWINENKDKNRWDFVGQVTDKGFGTKIEAREAALKRQLGHESFSLVDPSTPKHGKPQIVQKQTPVKGVKQKSMIGVEPEHALPFQITPRSGRKSRSRVPAGPSLPLFLEPKHADTPALPAVEEATSAEEQSESDISTTESAAISSIDLGNLSETFVSVPDPDPVKSKVDALMEKVRLNKAARAKMGERTIHGLKGRTGTVQDIEKRRRRSSKGKKAQSLIIEERAKHLARQPKPAPKLRKKELKFSAPMPLKTISEGVGTQTQPPSASSTEDEKEREADPKFSLPTSFTRPVGTQTISFAPDTASESSRRASIDSSVQRFVGTPFRGLASFARQRQGSKLWKRRENELAKMRWRRMVGWGSDWGPTKKYIFQ